MGWIVNNVAQYALPPGFLENTFVQFRDGSSHHDQEDAREISRFEGALPPRNLLGMRQSSQRLDGLRSDNTNLGSGHEQALDLRGGYFSRAHHQARTALQLQENGEQARRRFGGRDLGFSVPGINPRRCRGQRSLWRVLPRL